MGQVPQSDRRLASHRTDVLAGGHRRFRDTPSEAGRCNAPIHALARAFPVFSDIFVYGHRHALRKREKTREGSR
jgi:hypothetical protein